MPDVVNFAWKFEAKRIREAFEKGDYEPFKSYVRKKLETEESIQFLADGEEHLPAIDGSKLQDAFLGLGDFCPGAFFYIESEDVAMLFYGRSYKLAGVRAQRELDLFYQEGRLLEPVNLNIIVPENDNE